MLFDSEPDRECWHESGHAVVGHHFGMQILAVGFSRPNGPDCEPYPSTWVPTDGFDADKVATQLLAGSAAEIVKLGDFDIMACNSDVRAFTKLQCASSRDHYINQAMEIIRAKNDVLVRVYERLMGARTNPPLQPFIDKDGIKKQVHLTPDELESLVETPKVKSNPFPPAPPKPAASPSRTNKPSE